MKKRLVFTALILLALFSFLAKISLAQEETFSAQTESKTEASERVTELVKQKVKEKLEEILSKQKKVGWVGTIKSKDASTITLENQAKVREILYSDETKIVNLQSQSKKIEDLTEGKKIVALGYQQTPDIIEAKRIIITQESKSNKLPFLGILSDKSQVEKLIVVTSTNNKDLIQEIIVDQKTKIITEEDESGNYESLAKGQKVALVYQVIEEENTALMIRIIESVQEEPSPSLSPSPSPKPTLDKKLKP